MDEVIQQLHAIISCSLREGNRLDIFAALYVRTTTRIKEGIIAGRFEDGPRMERLALVFANRYFEAISRFRRGERPSEAWLVCFEAAHSVDPSVLRHLLLGINAHINLDLAIATSDDCLPDGLPLLKRDFDEINRILGEVFGQMSEELSEIALGTKLLDAVDPGIDDAVVGFCMAIARARAWDIAVRLAKLAPVHRDGEIRKLDRKVAVLGRLIRGGGGRTRRRLASL